MIRFREMFPCALMLGLVVAIGCSEQRPVAELPEFYPVRSDWLVVKTPSVQASKWYDPGYPPLLMLDRQRDTLTGDDAKLATEIDGSILNTRKIDADVHDEFGKTLTELYGTPGEPMTPNGEVLIEQLKFAEKLDSLRLALNAKREEVAAARASAKNADEQQLAGILEMQADKAAKDVSDLEAKVEHLRGYETELKLSPPMLKQGRALYQNYCQQCHGLTGNGNGPGGRYLIPQPRDYRPGLFKFITTNPLVGGKRKPSRADLQRTISEGIIGGPMPQFGALPESDLQALVSYVIHLSMRGEAEYDVMKEAANPKGEGLSREEVRKGLIERAGEIAPIWMASAQSNRRRPQSLQQ